MSSSSSGRLSWRARSFVSFAALAFVAGILVVLAPVANADAGNPILNTIKSSFRINADKTVDVYVRGQWNWISHTSDCNFDRAATGAGMIWNDPTEPGFGVGTRSATIVASPNGASESGNTVTLTTTSAHGFVAGQSITVAGVKVSGYNGTFTVLPAPTTTTLQYIDSKTGLANSGGGTITGAFAGVGVKTLRTGDTTNTIDQMVHPVDRGDIVEGYAPNSGTGGTNYASTAQGYSANNLVDGVPAGTVSPPYTTPESFNNPPSNPLPPVSTWKGGCGREQLTSTASKYPPGGGPLGEATGLACGHSGTPDCSGHPWGSWGYESALDGGPGCISSQTGLAQECQGYTHRYASISDVTVACVNFYDVHGGGKINSGKFQLPNSVGEVTVDSNGDNSIQTNAFNVLAGANCTGPVIPPGIDHTTAQTPVTVGDTITDTATLVNVGTKTVYVQFHLFAPGDTNCSGTDLYSGGRKGRTGDGDVTSDAVATTQTGDYHWTAELFDAQTGGNKLASTKCGDAGETSHVNKKQPRIVTSASGPATIGGSIHDTATLSAGFNPTGSIVFTAYAPLSDGSADTSCATLVFTSASITVNGNGDYGSGDFTPSGTAPQIAGTYEWVASYGGDGNNFGASTACGDTGEQSLVNKKDTTPSSTQTLLPNDSCHIDGLNPTGTCTFELFKNTDCSGTHIFSETDTLNGSADASTTNTTFTVGAGTYSWLITYSGDANNSPSTLTCATENFQITDG